MTKEYISCITTIVNFNLEYSKCAVSTIMIIIAGFVCNEI